MTPGPNYTAARKAFRDKQKAAAISFIRAQVELNGYPPSTHELMAHLNYKSTASVHHLLAELQAEGRIRRDPYRPRTIAILE